jgi:hypothetical protein
VIIVKDPVRPVYFGNDGWWTENPSEAKRFDTCADFSAFKVANPVYRALFKPVDLTVISLGRCCGCGREEQVMDPATGYSCWECNQRPKKSDAEELQHDPREIQ